ncbi:unnamed protein product [Amoebophrya sp. A120]|nr:unnamed protein product [Amoebophrya sp. A120]|eukprot:GSA120T00019931001.1
MRVPRSSVRSEDAKLLKQLEDHDKNDKNYNPHLRVPSNSPPHPRRASLQHQNLLLPPPPNGMNKTGRSRTSSTIPANDKISSRAAKIIDKKKMRRMGLNKQQVLHEIKILALCCHPNILEIFEAFESENEYSFVLEFCPGGDLQAVVENQGAEPFLESVIAKWMKQVLYSIRYLHSIDICHRDVKPHNFLFAADLKTLKLGDFGVAVKVMTDFDTTAYGKSEQKVKLLRDRLGTPAFMAPEMHLLPGKSKGYDCRVDVWAAGVIFVFLLSNSCPFVDSDNKLMKKEILEGKVPIWDIGNNSTSSGDLGTSGGAGSFFKSLFERFSTTSATSSNGNNGSSSSSKLPTSKTTRKPSLLAKQFVRALLQPDPDQRLDSSQACEHQWLRIASTGALDYQLDDVLDKGVASKGAKSKTSDIKAASAKEQKNAINGAAQERDKENEPLLNYQDFESVLHKGLNNAINFSKFLGEKVADKTVNLIENKIEPMLERANENIVVPDVVIQKENQLIDEEKSKSGCGICYQEDSSIFDFICPRCKYVCCKQCFSKLRQPQCPFCKYKVSGQLLARGVMEISEKSGKMVSNAKEVVRHSGAWIEQGIEGVLDVPVGGQVGVAQGQPQTRFSSSPKKNGKTMTVVVGGNKAKDEDEGKVEQEESPSPEVEQVKINQRDVCGACGKDYSKEENQNALSGMWDFSCPQCNVMICKKCLEHKQGVVDHRDAGAVEVNAGKNKNNNSSAASSSTTAFNTSSSSSASASAATPAALQTIWDEATAPSREPAVASTTSSSHKKDLPPHFHHCPSCSFDYSMQLQQHFMLQENAVKAKEQFDSIKQNVKNEVSGLDFGEFGKEITGMIKEDAQSFGSWLFKKVWDDDQQNDGDGGENNYNHNAAANNGKNNYKTGRTTKESSYSPVPSENEQAGAPLCSSSTTTQDDKDAASCNAKNSIMDSAAGTNKKKSGASSQK